MSEQRHITTEAIILKVNIINEINKYFIFISPTLGVQGAIAFGAAKIKSRFCSQIQMSVKAKLFLYKSPKSDFYKLEDISNITGIDYIKNDLEVFYLISFFNEIILCSFISQEEYKNFYYLLNYSLAILEDKKDKILAFIFFISKFIFLSGYNLTLDKCKTCGKNFKKYFFEFKNGAVFCEDHAKDKQFLISDQACILWKDFLENKYIILNEYKINEKDFYLLQPIINSVLKNIFEKELKTLNFIKEIFFK